MNDSVFTTQSVLAKVEESQRSMVSVLSYLSCAIDSSQYVIEGDHFLSQRASTDVNSLTSIARTCLEDLFSQNGYSTSAYYDETWCTHTVNATWDLQPVGDQLRSAPCSSRYLFHPTSVTYAAADIIQQQAHSFSTHLNTKDPFEEFRKDLSRKSRNSKKIGPST